MQFFSTSPDKGFDLISLLPGLMAMSILFGTTSMLAVTITFEKRGRSFDRLLLAPINLTVLVLAKISGAIIFGLIISLLPVILAAFWVDLSGINWGMVVLSLILMATSSTLLGLAIAISSKEVFEAQTYSNFFRFPMLFLSGLFIPILRLPVFLRPISYALPLTYGADILRFAITKDSLFSAWLAAIIMLAFTLLLFLFCLRRIKKKWFL